MHLLEAPDRIGFWDYKCVEEEGVLVIVIAGPIFRGSSMCMRERELVAMPSNDHTTHISPWIPLSMVSSLPN
jgi:hypothetical protein